MATVLANRNGAVPAEQGEYAPLPEAIEAAVVNGDLSKLNAEQRIQWYNTRCKAAGLNPATRPFEYITLQGKLTLYATKSCTDQLSGIHGLSHKILSREIQGELYVVTAEVTSKAGRVTQDIGVVMVGNLKGEAMANALMKGVTKAKRRATLSLCGLGDVIDETELDTVEDRRECTANGAPIPIDNNSGFGKGMYASPEQTEVYAKALDDYLAKRNAAWLDSWAGENGEIPDGVKGIDCSRWQADNHLVKWAVETNRLSPMDVESGVKHRQIGRFTAIVYHRSTEDRKALTQEMKRYFDTQVERAMDKLRREKPELFNDPEPDGVDEVDDGYADFELEAPEDESSDG